MTYTAACSYAEVLENTQFALIATVHKLYAMVRNGQSWEYGEPELNDRGQPVVHNIASMLGCIRPNSDIDLPVHSIFPEDEAGMMELARQLEEQQMELDAHKGPDAGHDNESSTGRTDRDSSSDLDHSDFERDLRNYRQAAFNSNPLTLSPQSFSSYNDFDSAPSEVDSRSIPASFPAQSVAAASFPAWTVRRSMDITPQYLQQASLRNMDMLNQGLLESDFGTLKPHVMSCPNPEVMLGMGDPMIYSGYDGEPMRL